jgi:hypothetical protein
LIFWWFVLPNGRRAKAHGCSVGFAGSGSPRCGARRQDLLGEAFDGEAEEALQIGYLDSAVGFLGDQFDR